MSSTYSANDGAAYERLMGRWSPLLAAALVAFAGIGDDEEILDLGCGTGSLSLLLAERGSARRILGIDIAEAYIAYAAARCRDPRLRFAVGDATRLDLPDRSVDRAFSLLALNFVPSPERAIAEMRRVTRPGGSVAAAVWDFAGGLVYQRIFWDTAAALDADAGRARARHFASPLTRAGELAAAFAAAGLREVRETSLTIRMRYADFADYWEPIREAQGPVGDYMKRLSPERVVPLREALCDAYCCGSPDGPRSMAATAWAVAATV
ncbi:MAG TPA: class I SAM-dependent methyltransferase [Stellaceae bacterium]|nr:class I SAM-dependent methyltransferase [Stellaceae bacterium]